MDLFWAMPDCCSGLSHLENSGRGRGAVFPSLHLISVCLSLSVDSFPLPLSNFIPITFYSWKSRWFPICRSLSLVLFFMVVLWLTLRCVTVSGDCISLHATFGIVLTKNIGPWRAGRRDGIYREMVEICQPLRILLERCICVGRTALLFSVHMRKCGIIQIYRVWRVPNK